MDLRSMAPLWYQSNIESLNLGLNLRHSEMMVEKKPENY